MKKGDIVHYTGECTNCHKYKYEVVEIYTSVHGVDRWRDLKAVNPDISTHYIELLSVEKEDIETIKQT